MSDTTSNNLAAAQVLADFPTVEQVRRLEAVMAQGEQTNVPLQHLVHGAMYARTALIPAGQVLTGAMTSADNIVVVCGDITVTTETGIRRITGYEVLPALAGRKRVGVTHADTWWTAIFQTDLQDIEAIENSITSEPEQILSRRLAIASRTRDAIEIKEPQ